MFSSVAPTEIIKGRSLYPSFPQWLGKNSTSRKAKRLIREIKQAMAHRVYADRYAIQNEIVPYLLQEIVTMMKKGTKDPEYLNELILFLDDLRISNAMIKEHLFILSLDKKLHT
jgi:replication factor C subunit 1